MSSTSWSEVGLYRKCPKAHDYRYRQSLQAKRPIIPMFVGKILHEMLDAHVNAKRLTNVSKDAWDVLEEYADKYKTFFAEEQEEYGDIPGNCERLFESYLHRYKNDELTYEGSEEFVAADLISGKGEGIRLVGYLDKIAIDAAKRRWLMDHKFHKSIPGPEDRFHELQLVIYFWAWNRWNPDRPADGIVWDYVRTAPPTEPTILKSGGLSQKKNIRCDRRTYEQVLKREKLDPKPYAKFLKHLEKNDTMFFERVFLPAPTKQMIEQVVEDFRTTAVTIKHMQGIAPRHMSKFNCQGCEFRKLCETEVRGGDAKFVKKAHYKKRERRDG